jgi:hypothetical protein
MYGMCRVIVDDSLKIVKIEAFFDPDSFLLALVPSVSGRQLFKECPEGRFLRGTRQKL